jgi:DNA primase
MVTHEYKVEGPVALMMTTTATAIDDELLNRCIVLSVYEGTEQTRAIHVRQREAETLEGHLARQDRERILVLHRNAQRLLVPLLVVNPFAVEMTFSDGSTRSRRDHRKLLTLVRAIALLHQHQRPVKRVEHNGASVEYIEVAKTDIETATQLTMGILGSSPDDLPAHTRHVLELLGWLVKTVCKEQEIEPTEYRFSRREAREQLGLGNTQAKVHLKRLVEAEYVIVHPAKHGRGVVYELAFYTYDGERSGANGHRPGHGRPMDGPRSGGGRGAENGTSQPESAEIKPERSGSPGTRHRGKPSKPRRTSDLNGAAR